MNQTAPSKRTALYYPTIAVPTGQWLRCGLLYFDEIASIVPKRFDEDLAVPYTTDMDYLRHQGAFREIDPDAFIRGGSCAELDQFEVEFKKLLEKARRTIPEPNQRVFSFRVHCGKTTDGILDYLARKELLRAGPLPGYLFEHTTALVYLSLLAQYAARADPHATVPSTDRSEYDDLLFRATDDKDGFLAVRGCLEDLLPTPGPDVPLSDILEFKQRRFGDLCRFRRVLDEFHQRLARVGCREEAKQVVVELKESVEVGIRDIAEQMKDARMSTIFGSLRSLSTLKSTMVPLAATALDRIIDDLEIPLSVTVAGTLVSGAIEVGAVLVDKANERRAALRESPFAYLWHARKARLTD